MVTSRALQLVVGCLALWGAAARLGSDPEMFVGASESDDNWVKDMELQLEQALQKERQLVQEENKEADRGLEDRGLDYKDSKWSRSVYQVAKHKWKHGSSKAKKEDKAKGDKAKEAEAKEKKTDKEKKKEKEEEHIKELKEEVAELEEELEDCGCDNATSTDNSTSSSDDSEEKETSSSSHHPPHGKGNKKNEIKKGHDSAKALEEAVEKKEVAALHEKDPEVKKELEEEAVEAIEKAKEAEDEEEEHHPPHGEGNKKNEIKKGLDSTKALDEAVEKKEKAILEEKDPTVKKELEKEAKQAEEEIEEKVKEDHHESTKKNTISGKHDATKALEEAMEKKEMAALLEKDPKKKEELEEEAVEAIEKAKEAEEEDEEEAKETHHPPHGKGNKQNKIKEGHDASTALEEAMEKKELAAIHEKDPEVKVELEKEAEEAIQKEADKEGLGKKLDSLNEAAEAAQKESKKEHLGRKKGVGEKAKELEREVVEFLESKHPELLKELQAAEKAFKAAKQDLKHTVAKIVDMVGADAAKIVEHDAIQDIMEEAEIFADEDVEKSGNSTTTSKKDKPTSNKDELEDESVSEDEARRRLSNSTIGSSNSTEVSSDSDDGAYGDRKAKEGKGDKDDEADDKKMKGSMLSQALNSYITGINKMWGGKGDSKEETDGSADDGDCDADDTDCGEEEEGEDDERRARRRLCEDGRRTRRRLCHGRRRLASKS